MVDPVAQKLVEDNVNLVYHIVRRKFNFPGLDSEMDDLFQEGMMGLMKAAETYKGEKECKFSTYAGVVITNQVLMYLRKYRKMKIDVSLEDPTSLTDDGTILVEDTEGVEDVYQEGPPLGDCVLEILEEFNKKLRSERSRDVINEFILTMVEGERISLTGICDKVGVTRSSGSRLWKAFRVFAAKRLTDMGYEIGSFEFMTECV